MPPADLPRLPPRDPDAHKGTFGRVVVVAGSRGMTGAAVLSGSAAVRGGAGLVWVATPADAQAVVAAGNPCYLTAGLPAHADGTLAPAALGEVVRLAEGADVLAVGPGLGHRPDTAGVVRGLLLAVPDKPVVLDADALNILSPARPGTFAGRAAATVLTPHPGEFGRLLGESTAAVQADREAKATAFARQHGVVVLLKGRRTVVTDGRRVTLNPTGNPGMATGGCGDVLTGLIAALMGQGLGGYEAAVLGAWLHGRAGDLGAAELSEPALCAADVLAYLPRAFKELE